MEDTLVRLFLPAIGLISGLIGTYVRSQECALREANVQQRIEAFAAEMRRDDH